MKKKFFNALNYTIGNEDASLEMEILPRKTQHVFVIAGSGSRVIPLIAKAPKVITCVDSSFDQLSLAELRISSLKTFKYDHFLSFWGYPGKDISSEERKKMFFELKISNDCKKRMESLFKANNWETLLYLGKWEQTFKKISNIVRAIVGERGVGLFNCKTMKEQREYLEKVFPWRAWSLVVFLLGNSVVFNALLYKGNFPKKNIKESMYSFYSRRFGQLFRQDIARKNFFLQLLFFGELKYSDGLPIECNPEVYSRAQKNLQKLCIKFEQGDFIKKALETEIPIDFLSLSDLPSYLNPPKESEFIQVLNNNIAPKGMVVNRYYLRTPERLDIRGFENVTSRHKGKIAKEKIQMFSFDVFQKNYL
ncbi:MAG: DUF3419 family protein [Patescibacteria group bacterium]